MPTPSTSIRELIYQNLKTSLVITAGASYFNTIPAGSINIVHGSDPAENIRTPYIYIYPGNEQTTEAKGERNKFYKTMIASIEAWIDVGANLSTMGTLISKLIHDIEKAVMVDNTRGGYAIDTRPISSQPFMESLASGKCGVIVDVVIEYLQDALDPSA